MGGGKKLPGKKSGVTADDISQSPDISKPPGKTNLVQSMEVGDQWIDHGSVCDGKDTSTPGCFMDNVQRMKLVIDLKMRAIAAAQNYKFALVELKFEELLKKEEDLPWVLSLALDLIGAHLIKVATKATLSLKGGNITRLDAVVNGPVSSDQTWRGKLMNRLSAIDNKTIESNVKTALDPLKKAAKDEIKHSWNGEVPSSDKASKISYIDQLKDQCGIDFQTLATNAAGYSNDAALVVLWEGLHETHHTVSAYKAALSEKLKRFQKSGARDVGRNYNRATRDAKDTRVIWIEHDDGNKTLHFQTQEWTGVRNSQPVAEFGTEPTGLPDRRPGKHGEKPFLGAAVPPEFVDVALARSEQTWGPTETIKDPSAGRNPFVPQTTTGHNPFVPQTPPPKAASAPAEPSPATAVPKIQLGRKPDDDDAVKPNWDTLPDSFKNTRIVE